MADDDLAERIRKLEEKVVWLEKLCCIALGEALAGGHFLASLLHLLEKEGAIKSGRAEEFFDLIQYLIENSRAESPLPDLATDFACKKLESYIAVLSKTGKSASDQDS